MLSRSRFPDTSGLTLVLLVVALAGPRIPASYGQGPEEKAGSPTASPGQAELEKTIRAIEEGFVRDYNKGDSKAVAALFTDDAEVVDIDGAHYQGRDVIEQGFAETFTASKGAKIALEIFSIRSLSPDVAQEQGRSVVTPSEGAPSSRLYTVLYVKRDGRWLVSSVRDDDDPTVPPHERLKELEWMTGDWVDEGDDSLVRLNCRWSDDGNYLFRTFSVQRGGKPVLNVTQRIGWDPLARQVRSWEFDSDGGFGEGRWSRDGARWVVKHTAVRPEGKTASATNIMTRERSDLIRWSSTDRSIGDESIPGEVSYVLVRVPPPPGRKTSSTSTPPNTRSPR